MITNSTLKGKKILVLCVKLFNYENEICNKLRDFGAIVKYYDERPKNSLITKGLIRINRNLIKSKITEYYDRILADPICSTLDYVLVIKGEVVPSDFLSKIKTLNPKCKFIYYTWDSFTNNKHALTILKHFDSKFTFDLNDSNDYDLDFRPLFYSDRYDIKSENRIKYKLVFFGTAHSDRYMISNTLMNEQEKRGFMTYAFYYMQSIYVYYYMKFLDKGFKKSDLKKLSFKSKSVDQIVTLINESLAVLDIQHPNQSGLTMRTFETLGSSKKLVTTNSSIKDYIFYNEQNIHVVDRNSPSIPLEFFTSDFLPLDHEVRQNMSLDGWVKEIFESSKNKWTISD